MHDELTKVDIKKMQEEIDYRKTELLPKLKERLKQARELGDLSENDEYHSAKRELGRNNSRIEYLQQMIDTAIIVESGSKRAGVIGLFDKVTLYMEDDDEEMTITLVTTLRQDSLNGFISKESPLGKAVMGKKVGDRAIVVVNENCSYYVTIRAVEKGQDDESLNISSF
ncbi:MAG: transcription elongation factor GreA [Ruminococcus sp.]|nr:transcription elongation factor GreA [Candidatus Apopatosoma intestinale]